MWNGCGIAMLFSHQNNDLINNTTSQHHIIFDPILYTLPIYVTFVPCAIRNGNYRGMVVTIVQPTLRYFNIWEIHLLLPTASLSSFFLFFFCLSILFIPYFRWSINRSQYLVVHYCVYCTVFQIFRIISPTHARKECVCVQPTREGHGKISFSIRNVT